MSRIIAFILSLIILSTTAFAQLGEEDTYKLGVKAYIYAYPIVLMDVTKRVMTNVPAPVNVGDKAKAPINQFANVSTFPTSAFKDVIRPNVDTLYSIAWLDLSKEPVILSVPDMDKRYYVFPALDMWTQVFAAPGSRTTGQKAGNYAFVGPNWPGKLPNDVKKIQATTNTVWLVGRTEAVSTADYDAVHKLQAQYKLTPLSAWDKAYTPAKGAVDSSIDMKTPPPQQVLKMDAVTFFSIFAKAMKANPPHQKDGHLLLRLRKIGIDPGKDFEVSKLTPAQLKALNRAIPAAQKMIAEKAQHLGQTVNGWNILSKEVGTYGTDYLQRAAIAMYGLGANLPEDAIYPAASVDANGKPLNGKYRYVLHFDKDNLPPVKGFWSVTTYSRDGYLVANSINRYAIGSHSKLALNTDGSLDIYIQQAAPSKEKQSNWLPVPSGNFNLLMRLYWPTSKILDGDWTPPAIKRV